MSQSYEVTGELADGKHLTLDETIPLPAGKVRVTIQELGNGCSDLAAFEAALRTRQAARGHRPPGKEEIDAHLEAERDGWDF